MKSREGEREKEERRRGGQDKKDGKVLTFHLLAYSLVSTVARTGQAEARRQELQNAWNGTKHLCYYLLLPRIGTSRKLGWKQRSQLSNQAWDRDGQVPQAVSHVLYQATAPHALPRG